MAVPNDDWVVAIPTFDRAESILQKTLALLTQSDISPQRIHVFADPTQLAVYKQQLASTGVHVIKGVRGICGQRNAIMRHFPPAARIVEIDDDIEEVQVVTSPEDHVKTNRCRKVPCGNISRIFDHLWNVADQEGCSLWGIFPVMQAFFMGQSYTVGLAKCTGQIQGYVNPGECVTLTSPVMEDYERCLAMFSRGQRCLRVNFLAVRTRNYAPGGCASACNLDHGSVVVDGDGSKVLKHPRNTQEAKAGVLLKKRYPELVSGTTAPKPQTKVVPVHGEVIYHAPGWRLHFSGKYSVKKPATDICREFAMLLGLGPQETWEHGQSPEAASVQPVAEGGTSLMRSKDVSASSIGTDERDGGSDHENAAVSAEDEGVALSYLILNSLKVADLRKKCREVGLDPGGVKSTLIDRLVQREFLEARQKAHDAEKKAAKLCEELEIEREKQRRSSNEDRAQALELAEALARERNEKAELQRQLELAKRGREPLNFRFDTMASAVDCQKRPRIQQSQHQPPIESPKPSPPKPSQAQKVSAVQAQSVSEQQVKKEPVAATKVQPQTTMVTTHAGADRQAVFNAETLHYVVEEAERRKERARQVREVTHFLATAAQNANAYGDANVEQPQSCSQLKSIMPQWVSRSNKGGLNAATAVAVSRLRSLHPKPEEVAVWKVDPAWIPPAPQWHGQCLHSNDDVSSRMDRTAQINGSTSACAKIAAVAQVKAASDVQEKPMLVKAELRSCRSGSQGDTRSYTAQVKAEADDTEIPRTLLLPTTQCIFWVIIPSSAPDGMFFLWDAKSDDPLFDCGRDALSVFCDPLKVEVFDEEDDRLPAGVSNALHTQKDWDQFPAVAHASFGGAFAVGLAVSRDRRRRAAWLALAVAIALLRNEIEAVDRGLKQACARAQLPAEEVPDFKALCALAAAARNRASAVLAETARMPAIPS